MQRCYAQWSRPALPNNDRVLDSVAAYSNAPQDYVERYSDHLLDRPRKFAKQLPVPSRILDLGCGPGRDLRIFAECGHKAIGLDLNPDFVQLASTHGDVTLGDIRDVASLFSPSSFDGIWAQASLVHLSHDETVRVLETLNLLLAPNGHFYACVSAFGETGWREEADGRRWYRAWPGHTFAEEVENAGFIVNEITDGVYVEVWATK
jgi:SAM-dependent methyltransferase